MKESDFATRHVMVLRPLEREIRKKLNLPEEAPEIQVVATIDNLQKLLALYRAADARAEIPGRRTQEATTPQSIANSVKPSCE